jgi:hypothetical protein
MQALLHKLLSSKCRMQANSKQNIKVAKPTRFNERWLKAYGLRVTARDDASNGRCLLRRMSILSSIQERSKQQSWASTKIQYQAVHKAMATRSHEVPYACSASREI